MIKLLEILRDILFEYSKNDPIPELTRMDKNLAILLVGPPASGKSTFYKDYILSRQRKIKYINPDDISYIFTKDPNIHKRGATKLSKEYTKNVIESGQNIVYDTTGSRFKKSIDLIKAMKQHGYKVIVVHKLIPLHIAKKRNIERPRHVDVHYLEKSYKISQEIIKGLAKKVDNYYIVVEIASKYKFFKYKNGKLLKRKVDKYIPV